MRFVVSSILALFFVVRAASAAAPMTVKDVAFMIRMGVSDAEVIAEVEKRRLLSAIDDGQESALRASGASATLISKLKSGNYALSSSEAAAVPAAPGRTSRGERTTAGA